LTKDVIPTRRVIITANAFRLPWTSAFFNHDATVRTVKAAVQIAEITIGTTKSGFLKWLPVNVTSSLVELEYWPLVVEFKMLKLPLLRSCDDDDMMVTFLFHSLQSLILTKHKKNQKGVLTPTMKDFASNILTPLSMHWVVGTRYTSSTTTI